MLLSNGLNKGLMVALMMLRTMIKGGHESNGQGWKRFVMVIIVHGENGNAGVDHGAYMRL